MKKNAAIKQIPDWIEEGYKYIPKELWDKWDDCVLASLKIYYGEEIVLALDIMKKLHSNVFQSKNEVRDALLGEEYAMPVEYILNSLSTDYNKLPEDIEKS